MADINIQMHKKNANGTYDNIFPKAKASYISTSDGSNVQAKLDAGIKNPNAITFTGGVTGTYDGSAAKTVAIPTSLPANGGNAATLNGYGTDNGSNSVLLSGRKASTTIGVKSTAEGVSTTASGYYAHAEGHSTSAIGDDSHAEGNSTIASGDNSHAEGSGSLASSGSSHAEGSYTIASGICSHAEGGQTIASTYCSHVMGTFNKTLSGTDGSFVGTSDAFVIGNGDSGEALSNAFRVTFGGKVYGVGSYNTSGADYSEYFEWLDENPSADDRTGKFVTLDGEKIKFANDGDYIVGIVSATPAIIGDSASESWGNRYVTDIFGRIQYHEIEVSEQTRTDVDGNEIVVIPAHTEIRPIANPSYDPTKENDYENREKRPEWATVGMIGKLIVIDDGSCQINGFCKPVNGIATASEVGYRVMTRLDETHIKVLIK